MTLASEIKKRKRFDSLEQEAMLSIARTHDVLSAQAAELFKPLNLSTTQYNVLRILRGAGEPLACGEIADRMITRDPDITRLLDRMEKRKLVSRCRDEKDRRVVCTKITPAGLKLLAELDGVVIRMHRKQLGHLGEKKLKQLIELLEEARQRREQPNDQRH